MREDKMERLFVYLRLATASIKSRMEYRASFFIFMGTIIIFYMSQVLTIGVVINRFKNIGGWSMGEMAFLYSLLVLSQGIVSSAFSGLLDFSTMVRDGSFDRFMIRPLSSLGQVIMNGFEITGIAHVLLGIVAVILANSLIEINWTTEKIFMLVLVVLGGSCILAGIRILIASIAFVAINNQSLVHLFVFSSREFLLYPMNIYSGGVRFLLTFILPLGFINFYPAHYFLDKSSNELFHPYFIYLTFPVGVLTLLASLYIWKIGKNSYESAGG
ncbi:MAG: ABC-2 family transporter protein [Leptospiraceae bacterium]|nr:ABC-2 family transporter protein [Leptospiraceae bacterium]